MELRWYTVRSDVADKVIRGITGLNLQADSRDHAISEARRYYRKRGLVVRHIISARLTGGLFGKEGHA